MTVRGALIDVDGTLVLSNDAHAQAWVAALGSAGYDVALEQVRPLIGMGGDQLLPRVVPGLDVEAGEGKRIASHRKDLFLHEFAPHLRAAPGARALIEHMHAAGLRLIVASSASPDELSTLLRAAQVEDLLPEATTAGDVESSKPAPDIVAVALRTVALPPEQVLLLGDTPYDIASAGRAGVGVIALRCGGFSEADLAAARARYDDPADLLAHYAESPFA